MYQLTAQNVINVSSCTQSMHVSEKLLTHENKHKHITKYKF